MNAQISYFDLGWIIGIIDGEGCFDLHPAGKEAFAATVQISNTSAAILDRSESILKRLANIWIQNYKLSSGKTSKKLIVGGIENLRNFLKSILPYMECRREEAVLLNKFCRIRMSKGRWARDVTEERKLFKRFKSLKEYSFCLPVLKVQPFGLLSLNEEEKEQFDLGWLSGIIDGEGSFFARLRADATTYNPGIGITSTNFRIIDKTDALFSRYRLARMFYAGIRDNRRVYYDIKVVGMKRVNRVLTHLIEHLQCKQPQAKLLLDYTKSRLSRPINTPITREEKAWMIALQKLNS